MALSALDRALAQRVERAVGTFFAPRLAGVSNTRWDAWTDGRGTMSAADRTHLSRLEYAARHDNLPRSVRESIADQPRDLARRVTGKWLDRRASGKQVSRRDAKAWRRFVWEDLALDPDEPELSDT